MVNAGREQVASENAIRENVSGEYWVSGSSREVCKLTESCEYKTGAPERGACKHASE